MLENLSLKHKIVKFSEIKLVYLILNNNKINVFDLLRVILEI